MEEELSSEITAGLHVVDDELLGLGESQPLGVVLALVVGLCDRQRAEGGVTQLTVVVLRGQDDPGGPPVQRLQTRGRAGRRVTEAAVQIIFIDYLRWFTLC